MYVQRENVKNIAYKLKTVHTIYGQISVILKLGCVFLQCYRDIGYNGGSCCNGM